MSRLATALILLAAIGLAVFVGTTSRWRFSPDRLSTVGSPLFRFDPADIHAIKIKNGDTTYTLEQSGEGWRISTGNGDDASPEMINALMQAALETPILDRIDASELQDEKNLSPFGVGKSSLQIDFIGDRPGTLLIGKNSPDGTRSYVSFKDSNTVYLVPKSFSDIVSTNPEAFRERRLLTVDPATIDRLTIRRGPSVIELQRTGNSWEIVKPVVDRANSASVQNLLDTLSRTSIQSFTDKKAVRRNEGKSIDVAGSIEIRSLATDSTQRLAFSPPDVAGARTVTSHPRNVSGLLPTDTPDLLSIDLDSLRDPALALINPDMVDVVKIKTPQKDLLLSRDGDSWIPYTPSVEDLVSTLAATRVSSYRPATPAAMLELGLSNPAHRIDFTAILSENTPEALAGEHPVLGLSIGSPQPDGTVPVLITGSPEIRFVPAGFLDSIGGL